MSDENTSSSVISEEEFLSAVSPTDLKGRVNLRVESILLQELEDVAEDNRYPLRSVSEVVRFCCQSGLQRLRDWKPAPTLLGALKAANSLIARDKLQCETVDMVERMSQRVEWYISKGAYDEAIAFVAQIRSYFDGLEDDFWKTHILGEIDAKFEQWLARIEQARGNES